MDGVVITHENPYGWLTSGCKLWGEHPGTESFEETPGSRPFSDYKDLPFDFSEFLDIFSEFKDSPHYTKQFLSGVSKQARMFIKPSWCRELDGPDRTYAYYLMVAHMAVLIKREKSGLPGTSEPGFGATANMDVMPGVMTSASVGGVSVSKTGTMQPKGYWDFWLYQTSYGRTLLAFLGQAVAAGMYYCGEENIADCLR